MEQGTRPSVVLRTGAYVAALCGGLAGLAEAALVAADSHRPAAFFDLFGYAVVVDGLVFGLAGFVLALALWRLSAALRGRADAGHVLAVVAGLSCLAAGGLVYLRWRQLFDPHSVLPLARRLPAEAAIAASTGGLALLAGLVLARRGRPAVRAFARAVPLALGLLLVVSGLGIARDLAGYQQASRPAQPAAAVPEAAPSIAHQPVSGDAPVVPADVPSNGAAAAPASQGSRPIAAPRPVVPQPPNVLLVTIDSLRADRLGAYGHAAARTPTLDRLAAEGVRFARNYTNRNATTPAHASLFTGTYPSTHGVRSHMLDLLAPGVPTLAELLAARGYLTAGMYSWLAFEPAYSGLERGFEVYRDMTINLPSYLGNPRTAALAATYKRLKTLLALPSALDSQLALSAEVEEVLDGKADVTTDGVLLWLEESAANARMRDRPLFLWVHYWDPHYPFTPPAPFDRLEPDPCPTCPDGGMPTIRRIQGGEALTAGEVDRLLRFYDAEIAFLDQELARLLAGMEQHGLLEDIVVVVVGDHGESFGEQGRWLHGMDLLAPEIHVPLLLRYPRALPAGTVVSDVTRSVDVMPTLLELLGVPLPPRLDGRGLLPLVRGEEAGDERVVVSELADRSIVTLVTREWQLLKDNASGGLRLYRVADGPDGPNLASSLPELAAELERRLDAWQAAHP